MQQNNTMCSPFLRHSAYRSSTSSYASLKQPKLPGAERFRFTRSSEDLCNMSAAAAACSKPPSPILGSEAKRYRRSTRYANSDTVDGNYFARHSITSNTTTNAAVVPRSEHHRRKPIIPISKQTSRVLNNTNAELSADAIEFIRCETANLNGICRAYVRAGAPTTTAKPTAAVDSVLSRSDVVGTDRLCSGTDGWSKPSFTTFLGSKRTESEAHSANNNNNNNIAGSLQSNKPNHQDWMHLRIGSGSSGSPSPTLSLCSNDSAASNNDVWVLRQGSTV